MIDALSLIVPKEQASYRGRELAKKIKGEIVNADSMQVYKELKILTARPLKKENYQNLKTQCYYKLAELINKGQIGITCPDINVKNHIIEECEQVRMKDADKDTKLQIVPKEIVKDIIGRSPDYSDALAMRMYYEIDGNFGKYFVQ